MAPAPRPLRKDAAAKESRILAVAAAELAADPDASVDVIAARAGVSRATFYRRFPSRSELVSVLRGEAAARSLAVLRRVDDQRLPSGLALDAVIGGLGQIALEYRALFVDGLGGHVPAEQYDAIRARLIALMRQAQHDGVVTRDVPPQWLVATLSAQLAVLARASDIVISQGRDPLSVLRTTVYHGITASGGDRPRPARTGRP